MSRTTRARFAVLLAMVIFGTIGAVRGQIPLGSATVAMARGLIGTAFLLPVMAVTRHRIDFAAVKKNAVRLLASGALLGLNWIMLFEAYRYTSIAVATLCYYMAPVFVVLISPLLFRTRYTAKGLICAAVAMIGMIPVSGVLSPGQGATDPRGIAFGLIAAAMYAAIVLVNKRMTAIEGLDRTAVQLAVSAVVLAPYVLLVEKPDLTAVGGRGLIFLLLAGILHTGVAYALYFGAMDRLPARTLALYGYIDPVVAVLCSALLGEPFGFAEGAGILLILGAAFVSEWQGKKKDNKKTV